MPGTAANSVELEFDGARKGLGTEAGSPEQQGFAYHPGPTL